MKLSAIIGWMILMVKWLRTRKNDAKYQSILKDIAQQELENVSRIINE